ncbi:MAG: hypothetical protein Q9204_006312 [Flavoplaca sp. TL-2023a]
MDVENQQRLQSLDKLLINIESLLEASRALDGSNVTTLDLDQAISHLTSELSTLVPRTSFRGNDSVIFLLSKLTNLHRGLQRLGFDLKGLELSINGTIAKMCSAYKIEPRQIGINHDWAVPLISWTQDGSSMFSNPPRQYVYLVHINNTDGGVHVVKTATGGRLQWSWSIAVNNINIGWSSANNKMRLYQPGAAPDPSLQTQILIPDLPGKVCFFELVSRSDSLKVIDKLSTVGTVKSVSLKSKYVSKLQC